MTPSLRILVVEDNSVDSDIVAEWLPANGSVPYQLTTVECLAAALTRLQLHDTDVVLLDLGLPDSQGLATFHQMHQAAPHLPVIILSGIDDLDLAITAVHDGAQDYLVKGQFNHHLLRRSIRYAYERQKAEKHIATQLAELQRWQKVMLNREDRLQELKREVNELCHQLALPARYPSQAAEQSLAAPPPNPSATAAPAL